MKILFIICITILLCCIPEMPEFERINNERLRVLAVIFTPGPEVAPGDTVTAKAYFAGKQAAGVDNFKVSYSRTASDSFIDHSALNIIKVKHWFPDSVELSFKVSESLFITDKNETGIPSDAIRAVHAASGDSAGCEQLEDNFGKDIAHQMIDALFKESALFFTIHSEDGTTLKVQSRFMARYTPRFKKCVPVNNNPEPSKIFFYSVAEDSVKDFDPTSSVFKGKFTAQMIYNPDTLLNTAETLHVVKGCSYFLIADSVKADTYTNNLGKEKNEIIKYSYFYEIDDGMRNSDSIITKATPTSPIAEFRISEITGQCLIKIWLVTHDDCNDAIRPKGFALSTMSIVVIPEDEDSP